MKASHPNSGVAIHLFLAGVVAVGSFVFFQFFYPYHLLHREQTMLFLDDGGWIGLHYPMNDNGWLVRLMGDWCQQYFYYLGVGPVCVSVVLALIWWVTFRTAFCLLPDGWRQGWMRWLPILPATVLTLWEGGRECGDEYPFASSLQVLIWLAVCYAVAVVVRRDWHGVLRMVIPPSLLVLSTWICGIGLLPDAKWIDRPNFLIERNMALDCEAYYQRWDRVEALAAEAPEQTRFIVYYANLAKAMQGELTDGFLERNQESDGSSLFLPIDESSNYFFIGAASELWWHLGELTMAEHATILSEIFSPRRMSSRALRRLAQVNLVAGADSAALKYLNILRHSAPHSRWAEEHLPGRQSERVQSELHRRRLLLPESDTLHYATDVQASLRHLLMVRDAEGRVTNRLAHQYLLAYDLLNCWIYDYRQDLQKFGVPALTSVHQEAMLVVMAGNPQLRDAWQSMGVSYDRFKEFQRFSANVSQSCRNPLYANTYWRYYMVHQGR